jgi:hypothetical protein
LVAYGQDEYKGKKIYTRQFNTNLASREAAMFSKLRKLHNLVVL